MFERQRLLLFFYFFFKIIFIKMIGNSSPVDSGNYDLDSTYDESENSNKRAEVALKELEDIVVETTKELERQKMNYIIILEWLEKINRKYCSPNTKDFMMKVFYGSVKSFDSLYSNTFNCTRLKPKFIVGKEGNKVKEFIFPWGIHADFTGRILVADRLNHRIQIFSESGQFLHCFGKEGTGYGEFCRPVGIFVDKNWRIIVADKDNHRIQVFTFNGAFWFSFGKKGSGLGEFNYPWNVAVNSTCQIAVSDSKNHRVQLFDSRGQFINSVDFRNDIPRGLAFRSDDSLIVAGFESHVIKIFHKNLKFSHCLGQKGKNEGEFFRPQGLACDEAGRIAVSDSKNYRVQILDAEGKFLKMFGSKGNAPGEFDCPQGICFHPNGSLLVVDLNNNRFQAF